MLLAPLTSAFLRLAVLQDSPAPVELAPRWEPGLRYTIELVKEREDSKGGKRSAKNVGTTPIAVEVLSKDESGYTTSWTFGATKVEAQNPIASMLASKVASANEGWVLRLRHDADGTVTGVVDEDEARSRLFATMDEVVKTTSELPGAKAQDVENLKRALEASKRVLDGPAFAATILKDPSMIYTWCGGSIALGEKREFDSALPSPFGGDPIPSRVKLELVRHDAALSEAELEWHQALDPEKTKVVIESWLKDTAEKMGKPVPEGQRIERFSIVDEGRWIFDTKLGLPREAVWTRTVTSNDSERVETMRARVKLTEPK